MNYIALSVAPGNFATFKTQGSCRVGALTPPFSHKKGAFFVSSSFASSSFFVGPKCKIFRTRNSRENFKLARAGRVCNFLVREWNFLVRENINLARAGRE